MRDVRICLQIDTSTSPDDRILHSRSRRGRPARRRLLSNDARTYKFLHQPRYRRYSIFPGLPDFNARGSGFTIDRILEFTIVITTYRPLHGRSYIPSPKYVQIKHCVVNVRTKSVSYERYFPVSAILRVTRNTPITINLT